MLSNNDGIINRFGELKNVYGIPTITIDDNAINDNAMFFSYLLHNYRDPVCISDKYVPERIDINKKKLVVHVKWTDGKETKVKLMPGDIWDEYDAFCICLAKRIYGTNSYLKRTIDSVIHYPDEKNKKGGKNGD